MKSATPQDEIGKVFATAVDLHQKGHLREAESLYRAILAVDASHTDALHLAGVAAHQRGDHVAAAEMIARAIALNGQVAQFHFHRGIALQALNDLTGAVDSYRHAVRLKPDFSNAWENLGVALQDANELDLAREAYEKALSIDANSVLAHQNLGTLLFGLGNIRDAQVHFEAVLAIQPAHAEARAKHASTLLAQARYEEGWHEFEWRHHATSVVAHYRSRIVPFPKWDGSSLADKTLLIHPEQGIGEELLFASCYADAIARAKRTIIECDARLTALFARSFPSAEVIAGARWEDFAWERAVGSVDFRVPAGSLPRFFRQRSGDFPGSGSCLRVDPARHEHWRAVLAQLEHPINIGVSWTGGKDARAAKARSIALAEWRPIFDAVAANFISVQYGDHTAPIEEFNRQGTSRLHALDGFDAIKDPDDAMALISALDLVISIDNSTVFMAGSIGTPTWILLPSNGEWRWRGADERSPWYPHARLFRQAQPGTAAWRAVLANVASELSALAQAISRKKPSVSASTRAAASINNSATSGARALLVNDTRSWYHWGCSCTSLAIHSRLRERFDRVDSLPIHRILQIAERPKSLADLDDDAYFATFAAAHADVIQLLQRADVVYVNGEGTLHGLSAQSMNLLYLAYIAKRRFGRTVRIVNHSCYPDDTTVAKESPAFQLYRRVYEAMDFIAVREPVSAQLLREMGLTVTESFDCLPLFVRDHAELLRPDRTRSVVIAGSAAWGATSAAHAIGEFICKLHASGVQPTVLIGADAHLAADDVQFAEILQRVAGGRFQLLNATSELEWLRAIASARLLISGRFHHSIAAACVNTPFLLLESNTPKIAGLLQRLGSNAFVSIREQGLSDTLYQRTHEIRSGATPPSGVSDRLAEIISLAELNFSS